MLAEKTFPQIGFFRRAGGIGVRIFAAKDNQQFAGTGLYIR